MDSHLSTSNFDEPWPREIDPPTAMQARRALTAWILALATLLAIDGLLLGDRGPWTAIQKRIDSRHSFELGIVAGRLAMQRLRSASPLLRHVVVAGSSQARGGFQIELLGGAAPETVVFGKIAHGGFGTFAMRSMVGDVLNVAPNVVVLFISPLDLNSRLRILPQVGTASFSAILDLIRETGTVFSFNHRQIIYQLLAADLLNSYRYRQVLDRAFAGKLRRAALASRSKPDRLRFKDVTRRRLPRVRRERLVRELIAEFPNKDSERVEASFHRFYNLARGEHCRIQHGLVRRTIHELTQAGVEVVIVEAPLHPLASEVYDPSIREDYLRFGSSLERDFGVRLVALESSGPFTSEDFWDPIHVNVSGAVKLTRATLCAVYEVLELPSIRCS